jgi:hypothetical protein
MTKYHISVDGKDLGCFTMEQLQQKKIAPNAIVWHEKLKDWTPIKEIDELKSLINTPPPPLPKKPAKRIINFRGHFIVGVFGLVLSFILKKYGFFDQLLAKYKGLVFFILIVIRIIVAYEVRNYAKEFKIKHRNWTLFAFFFPTLTLISFGFAKPKKQFNHVNL